MIDFKEIELSLLESEEDLEDMTIEEVLEVWRDLRKQQEALKKLTADIGNRLGPVEEILKAFAEESDAQTAAVENAVLKFKERKGTQSVKYKEAFMKAMDQVSKRYQAIMAEALQEFTTLGNPTTKVDVLDPEIEAYMQDLRQIPAEKIWDKVGPLGRFAKNIKRQMQRDGELEESIKDKTKEAMEKVKAFAKKWSDKFVKKLKSLEKPIEKLEKINDQFAEEGA